MKAWEMAAENPSWYVGTNKSTQGPKDPLPFDIKVKAMEAVYPEIKGHIVAEQSWLTLASKIYEKHGNIVLNVYTDEAWVTKALVQYNGKEGAHGYYDFGTIQQQETPRLSSATALRNAVAADDRDLFGQAAGVDPNTLVAGHPFFDVVKHYLMPHAEKAAAKPVKKKVKEPVAELSSELLGRYKKAAGIDARRADAEGDYARGNKRFSGIVKATKKQFANDEKGVAEVSKDTLDRYVTKAVDAHGHADFAARQSKNDPTKRSYHVDQKKTAEKRRQGISRALDRMSKDDMAEGAPIVVAQAPIDIRNPKKAPQPYRNQGDIVPPTKPPSTEKRGVKGRPGQRPMPKYDESSSNAMSDTAKRLANKDDGKVAKLRAAGDKRREEELKGRDIAKRNESVDLKQENAWDRLQREKALESAGVGIITKQNSTVDVNKNTPKKNLKAFRLI
jgi:hypothetical protein